MQKKFGVEFPKKGKTGIQGETHKVLQSDSTQTIDHIQKCFSVREGRHTRPPYFLTGGGAEAMSRTTPLF